MNDTFGGRVALSDDTAVIGAGGDHDGGPASGAAYAFVPVGGLWTATDMLSSP